MTTPRTAILAAAASQLGVPYSYGGGDIKGPGLGIDGSAHVVGYDCARLTRYVFYQGARKFLAYGSEQQMVEGVEVGKTLADVGNAQPGDLCFFDNGGHVGIYAAVTGVDQFGQHGPLIIHAPYPGVVVRFEVINPEYLNVCSIRQYVPRETATPALPSIPTA
jgi:hypothetical protein